MLRLLLYLSFLYGNTQGKAETALLPLQNSCSCAQKYPIAGTSFTVYGRLSYWNGNPAQRIWVIGTRRMLGIRGDTELPDNLAKLLGDFDTEVYGDFTVCPLTKSQTGVMQIVCVQSANNLKSKKRR